MRHLRAAAGIVLVQGKPAYRCRHGHTTAARPDRARPPNAYVREDQILPAVAARAEVSGAWLYTQYPG